MRPGRLAAAGRREKAGRGRRLRADTGAMAQHGWAYLSPSALLWEYLELPLAPLVWDDLEPRSDAGPES